MNFIEEQIEIAEGEFAELCPYVRKAGKGIDDYHCNEIVNNLIKDTIIATCEEIQKSDKGGFDFARSRRDMLARLSNLISQAKG